MTVSNCLEKMSLHVSGCSTVAALLDREIAACRQQGGKALKLRLMGVRMSSLRDVDAVDDGAAESSKAKRTKTLEQFFAKPMAQGGRESVADEGQGLDVEREAQGVDVQREGQGSNVERDGQEPNVEPADHNLVEVAEDETVSGEADGEVLALVPCPICGQLLPAADNGALNQHVDLCLNGPVVAEVSSSSSMPSSARAAATSNAAAAQRQSEKIGLPPTKKARTTAGSTQPGARPQSPVARGPFGRIFASSNHNR